MKKEINSIIQATVIPDGNLASGGLVKLIEECAEIIQVAAKQLGYPQGFDHWDGKGSLKERLEEEIADAKAAMLFVEKKWELNSEKMKLRTNNKLELYNIWDSEK